MTAPATTRDVDPIEKLRALLSEATPGPWEVRAEDGLAAVAGRGGWVMEGDAAPAEVDAELIAALRNLAPELLACAEAIRDMREGINDMEDAYEHLDALRAKASEVLGPPAKPEPSKRKHTIRDDEQCVSWCEACSENCARGFNPDGTERR